MESTVYNIQGKEIGKVKLPESVFAVSWNGDLVHQVLTSEMANRRTPIAHTKTRGEVSGGGKKPWQQKGTGRARHGSTRSPIWRHGGVTHGPRNDKNFSQKINHKMKAKALLSLLAKKNKEGEIIFIDSINFEAPKTRLAKNFFESLAKVKGLEKLSTKKQNTAYIAMTKEEAPFKKSFDNFSNIQVGDICNLNPFSVASFKYLVITNPDSSVKFLETKVHTKAEMQTEQPQEKNIEKKTSEEKPELKPKLKTVPKVKTKKDSSAPKSKNK